MELLAHASAPSSRKDDERFKRQAIAYSTFVPATSIPVLRAVTLAQTHASTPENALVRTPAGVSALYLDDTQLAISALDSQLFTSSMRLEDDSEDDSEEEGEEEVTPRPSPTKSDILPPNESSDVDESLLKSSALRNRVPASSAPIQHVSITLPPDGFSEFIESPLRSTALQKSILTKSSSAAQDASFTLPPSAFSGHNDSPSRNTRSHKRQQSPDPVSSRSYDQGNLLSSPLVPLHDGQNLTIGGFSTAQIWATPSRPLPDGGRNTTHGDLQEQSLSSPGDDIPSQLPSNYSLSDISSDDNSHHGVAERVMSSPWGNLPRGTWPEDEAGSTGKDIPEEPERNTSSPWGTLPRGTLPEDGSTGKGSPEKSEQVMSSPWGTLPRGTLPEDGSTGKGSPEKPERVVSSPWGSLPRGTLPEDSTGNGSPGKSEQVMSSPWGSLPRGTLPEDVSPSDYLPKDQLPEGRPSFEHRQANVSASIQPSSNQYPTSSVSLDRAINPILKRQRTDMRKVLFSPSKATVSFLNHAKKTQLQDKDRKTSSAGSAMPPPSTKTNMCRPSSTMSVDIPDTSSPVNQSQGDSILGSVEGAGEPANPRPRALDSSPIPKARLHSQSGTPSEILSGSSTPVSRSLLGNQSLLSSRVPETAIASKKRKFAAFSTPKTRPRPDELETLRSMPTRISPDPPPTSTEKFETHVTKYLLKTYFHNPHLHNRYNPAHVARELRQLERGYWLVDPSSWALAAQLQFWKFLQREIGTGSAGWGVWCMRGPDETASQEISIGKTDQDLGLVRVFCWGEVVPHIYLLLYVASECKVRNIEPRWIDADGQIIVRI